MKAKIMPAKKHNPMRYVMDDFLEIKTKLSVCEREMLMDKIETEAIQSDSLKSQPAFWMDDRVLLVLNEQPSECWFYYTRSGKMEKVRMKGAISALGQSVAAL